MPTTIEKRDGRAVAFEMGHVWNAIILAAEHHMANYEQARCVADEVTDLVKDKLKGIAHTTVETVQDIVIQCLKEAGYKDIADEYSAYRESRSRVREAKTRLMRDMTDLTFVKSRHSDDQRENANVDADAPMGTMLKYGSTASKRWCLTNLISKQFADDHISGKIHIHDLDFYALTTTCTQISLKKLFEGGFFTGHGYLREPNSIGSYAALACIAIQANQNDQHGGQSIPMFEYDLAPGVSKTFIKNVIKIMDIIGYDQKKIDKIDKTLKEEFTAKGRIIATAGDMLETFIPFGSGTNIYNKALAYTRKETFQAMEALIHNLNTMSSRAGAQVPFSSINYGTGTTEEQRMVMEECLNALEAGLGNGETSIFPIHVFKVKKGVNFEEGDPNYDLFIRACEVSAKRLFPNFVFLDAPYNAQFYKEGDPDTEVATMGCVAPESVITYMFNGELFVESIERMFNRVATPEYQNTRGDSTYRDTSSLNLKIWDSRTGKFVQVKTVIRNNCDGVWKTLTFSNGRILTATDDHPLPVDGKGRTLVRDIVIGDFVPNAVHVPAVATDKCSVDEAWLAGVVLCDACITNGVFVCCGIDEKDIADEVFRIGSRLPVSENARIKEHHRGMKGDYYEIHIGNKKCADYYRHMFEGGVKNKRHIPADVFRYDRQGRIAFLSGMIDADGYIHKRSTPKGTCLSVQLGTTNKELALQQFALAQSLGLLPKIYEKHYAKGTDKVSYQTEFAATVEILSALRCAKKRNSMVLSKSYPSSSILGTLVQVTDITVADGGKYSYDVETESDFFDVNGIVSHNCRTRVMSNVNGPSTTSGRGNLSFTTMNLPRLAIEANGDFSEFIKSVSDTAKEIVAQLLERYEVQATRHVYNYPFLMGQKVAMGSDGLQESDEVRESTKHGTLTIGFIGLAEAMVALFGKHHGQDKEIWQRAYETIKVIRNIADDATKEHHLNFSVIATPAEGLSGRFVRIDKERYGTIKGVTDRDYYTNSFHVPVYYPCSVFHKIDAEAPFHELCNGGHITYVELDGDVSKNVEAFVQIIKYMAKSGIGYGSVNHPVDRCPICGYTGIIGNSCPRCGVKEGQELTVEEADAIYKKFNQKGCCNGQNHCCF